MWVCNVTVSLYYSYYYYSFLFFSILVGEWNSSMISLFLIFFLFHLDPVRADDAATAPNCDVVLRFRLIRRYLFSVVLTPLYLFVALHTVLLSSFVTMFGFSFSKTIPAIIFLGCHFSPFPCRVFVVLFIPWLAPNKSHAPLADTSSSCTSWRCFLFHWFCRQWYPFCRLGGRNNCNDVLTIPW